MRDTCQPPRFEAAADRHEWHEKRVPAPATTSATSARVEASMPDSAAAKSKVKPAYSSRSAPRKTSKPFPKSGWHWARYSSQFHHRRTNSVLALPVSMMWRAMARLMAASLPGWGDSHQSAWVAVFDRRVSNTMTLAPLARASVMRWA